ncbi:DUF305 domain-containing protein [Rhodococcus rhodnii]|nr:DUF305 domain-containing protein [Rhodococcus rhodnii]TXG91645.1 DUF305 domain-containing protein [Rhodococcus rhodnii]
MTDPAPEPQPTPRSQRTALLVIGVVGVLVLGFAIGVLARFPFDDSGPAAPGEDSVDVGFAQDMSVHHSQAVEMSAAVLSSEDGHVRSLAYDILTTQQHQLGQMQAWLTLWGQPPLPTGAGFMEWMADDSGSHAHGGVQGAAPAADGALDRMPGMASSDEMAQLRQATGPEQDVLFLQLMLRHHEGGLPMMEYGAQHASESVVRSLAQTMVDTQESESVLMRDMLAARGAEPLPMN